jgi:hypothetical protein
MRNLPYGHLRRRGSGAAVCVKLAVTLFFFAALIQIPSLAARDATVLHDEASAPDHGKAITRASNGDELTAALAMLRRELTSLRAKVMELEGETLQVRDTLAAVQAEEGDRTAVVEVLAQDVMSLREELMDGRIAVTRYSPSSQPSPAQASRSVPDIAVTGSISKAPSGAVDAEPRARTESARPHTSLSPAAVEAWLTKADELLRRGDVSGARLALQPAIDAGSGQGAYKLAETYDPKRLSEWQVIGLKADAGKARELYELAHANGISSAGERLDALWR